MRYLLIFLFFIFQAIQVYPFDVNALSAARSEALGGAGVGCSDVSSAQQNSAIFGQQKITAFALSCQNRFLVNGFSQGALIFVYPINKLGNIGLTMNHFGGGPFGQTKAGLAYARSFGPSFFAGMQVNYISSTIGDVYGSSNGFTLEAGVQYKIHDICVIGAQVYNPAHTLIAGRLSERLPLGLKLGLDLSFSEKVRFVLDIEKAVDIKPVLKCGLEYQPLKPFCIRFGVRQQFMTGTGPSYPLPGFGFGFLFRQCTLDIAASWHSALGVSPALTFSYAFK